MSATRIAKQTFFNFLTIALNAANGLVLTAVIARWLGPEATGTYSLVTWFFTMAGLLVNLGLVTTTMKYLAEALGREDTAEAGAILGYGLKQLLFNGLVVTGLWLALSPWIAGFYAHPGLAGYMLLASIAIIPVSAMALLTAATQGLQRYGHVALATGAYTASMAAGSVTVLALELGIGALLAVMGLAATLACLIYLRVLAVALPRWRGETLVGDRRRTLRRYSGSLMFLILLDAIVWQRSGVFFLGIWSPAEQVGFYALAFSLATMAMRMIPGTLVGLLIPSMSRSFGAGDTTQVKAIYHAAGRWMAVLAMPVAVGGLLLAGPLVEVMYGAAYAPMAPILGVLLASGVLVMTFGFPASSVLYAMEGQRFLIRVGAGVAVLYLALAVALIPPFGALGAAVSTALAQVASLVPGAWYASRMLGGAAPAMRRLPGVLLAACAMGVPVWAIGLLLPALPALLVSVPLGALVYGVSLWLFQALEPEDWQKVQAVASRLPVVRRWIPAEV